MAKGCTCSKRRRDIISKMREMEEMREVKEIGE
jgi:hypothetical protein